MSLAADSKDLNGKTGFLVDAHAVVWTTAGVGGGIRILVMHHARAPQLIHEFGIADIGFADMVATATVRWHMDGVAAEGRNWRSSCEAQVAVGGEVTRWRSIRSCAAVMLATNPVCL